jgi:hypothetical protein
LWIIKLIFFKGNPLNEALPQAERVNEALPQAERANSP